MARDTIQGGGVDRNLQPQTYSAAQFRAADAVASASQTGVKPTATEKAIAATIPPFNVPTPAEARAANAIPATPGSVGGLTPTGPLPPGSPTTNPITGDAIDTFRKILSQYFGQEALTAGWVGSLYGVVNGYQKQGLDSATALNLSLQDARNNPALKPFADRFSGIFKLQDMAAAGKSVYVPTIAQYVQTQQTMGDVLKSAGLSDLATNDFTGAMIGNNVSASEVADRISKVYNVINNADPFLKQQFAQYFPTVTNTDLAKAILTGADGAQQLEQKVAGIEVKSAAAQQGLVASDPFNLAKAGITYAQAQAGYQQIARDINPYQNLAAIYGSPYQTGSAQQTLESATFGTGNSAQAQLNEQMLRQRELNTFGGASGVGQGSLGTDIVAGAI